MRWWIVALAVAVAAVGSLFLLVAESPSAEPWPGLEELRLFVSPANGTATAKFSACGLTVLGKGKFYKAGEELWLPVKDMEELPDDVRRDYTDPARGKAAFTPDRDGYLYTLVYLPIKGHGIAHTSINLDEKNITMASAPQQASVRYVELGGKEYVVYFTDVVKVVEGKNATVVIICGGDGQKVLERAREVYQQAATSMFATAERGEGKRSVFTPENSTRSVVLEFKIDAKPVRGFDVRPGYYVYRGGPHPSSEGLYEEVYRYYVDKTEEGYVVKVVNEFYLHKTNSTLYLGNSTHVYKIVNGTLYLVEMSSGDVVIIGNYTQYPTAVYCLPALAMPPIYPYLHERASFKVRLVENITHVPPLYVEHSAIREVEDSVRVRGVEDCRGPSGRCYVVEIDHTQVYRSKRGAETIREVYVLWVDLAGPVVKIEGYKPHLFGKDLVLKTELVEWK